MMYRAYLSSVLFMSFFFVLPASVFAADTQFFSLSGIPQLTEAAGARSMTDLVNIIYRICIGIAAVIAVAQIIRGGIYWAGGDSLKKKTEAKELIKLSLLGLILVLSPYIVFSIIDKRILELKFDPSSLSGSDAALDYQELINDAVEDGKITEKDLNTYTYSVTAGEFTGVVGKSEKNVKNEDCQEYAVREFESKAACDFWITSVSKKYNADEFTKTFSYDELNASGTTVSGNLPQSCNNLVCTITTPVTCQQNTSDNLTFKVTADYYGLGMCPAK